jgi:hypothetical protein
VLVKGLSTAESWAAQGIGRSRAGLTSKLHLLAEGHNRSLVTRITAGQAADAKELVALVDAVSVGRPAGRDRPRNRLTVHFLFKRRASISMSGASKSNNHRQS